MSTADKCGSSNSSTGLNESWVELSMSSTASKTSGQSTPRLEKLLVDAQKESGRTSSNSSSSGVNSSKALISPPLSAHSGSSDEFPRQTIPQEQLTEFINDWSSRPEIVPPSDYGIKLERPIKRHPLSVRNTRVMREGWFSSETLSALVVSNIASFAAGTLVCWYMIKNSGG